MPVKARVQKASVRLRVQPRAARERVAGEIGGEWKLYLAAPPVEGKANQACIDFFARGLRVPQAAVRIVAGETSRHKRVEIDGVSQDDLNRFLRESIR